MATFKALAATATYLGVLLLRVLVHILGALEELGALRREALVLGVRFDLEAERRA